VRQEAPSESAKAHVAVVSALRAIVGFPSRVTLQHRERLV
jgi:hypothetical protein